MRERLERSESELRRVEAQTEQVEQKLEEIENAIKDIEAAISRLEGKGDQDVAASLQISLAQKKQEKFEEERVAQELAKDLDQINSELCDVEQVNEESKYELLLLEQYDEVDVGDAHNLIADREQRTAKLRGQHRDLRQRLSRLSGGGGWG